MSEILGLSLVPRGNLIGRGRGSFGSHIFVDDGPITHRQRLADKIAEHRVLGVETGVEAGVAVIRQRFGFRGTFRGIGGGRKGLGGKVGIAERPKRARNLQRERAVARHAMLLVEDDHIGVPGALDDRVDRIAEIRALELLEVFRAALSDIGERRSRWLSGHERADLRAELVNHPKRVLLMPSRA